MIHHQRPQHFDGFTVSGFRHAQPDGSVHWHVSVYAGSNHTRPHHDWWVIGEDLHRTALTLHPTAGTTLAVGDLAADVDPAEKAAVLKAVAKWNAKEYAGHARRVQRVTAEAPVL